MTPGPVRQDDHGKRDQRRALKARIHADFVWTQIIRGKFRRSLQVGEKEVAVKLQGNPKQKQEPTGYEYSLRPILFLVPRGAAHRRLEARKREAENLRARFQSCDEGLRLAMGLPDVAVRETITRQSVRSRPAAARRAQQHAGRPADAAGRDLAGRRAVRRLQQDRGERRRDPRPSARCARPCTRSDIRRCPRSISRNCAARR